jgi:hypothetical protein
MEKEEREKILAEYMQRKKGVNAAMKTKTGNGEKELDDKGKSALAERIARLKRVLAKRDAEEKTEEKKARILAIGERLRAKIEARKKKAESVTDNAQDDIDGTSTNSDYSVAVPAPENATGADLEKLKKEQLDTAPPTLLAEDVREAFKKGFRIAWARFNKNLESSHEIKASLYDKLMEIRIHPKTAQAVIETAFSEAGDGFLASLLKRAEDISKYSAEALAEIEGDLTLTCQIIPAEDESDFDVDEGSEEELEERLVEGSFRLPKIGASNKKTMLSRALPGYRVPGE